MMTVGLGRKPEAFRDPEFLSGAFGVVLPAAAPKVQRCALAMEAPDLLDYARHWNTFGADRTDERVINVNVHD